MSRAVVGVLLLLIAGPLAAADGAAAKTGEVRTAIFAGGCFWCSEADFEKLPGVIAVESGYTAGRTANPTYEQVSAGGTQRGRHGPYRGGARHL
ncbi:MAG: Peptide methionine sulfoxide reductase MsrA 1 [Candidatus Accumulibacter sp. BA-94]|nr:MAG: Peptide methionine sulfoxide reductase MsrA 1 [Candidatus Accumulibacter sp. BA-94]